MTSDFPDHDLGPRVNYHYENTEFRLADETQTTAWLHSVIENEEKSSGTLNVIFTDDETLLKMNRKHLNHDYFTDVITFPFCEQPVSGDVYISIERLRENSRIYGVKLKDEVARVMVHGVLHLLGYNDKTEQEKTTMRIKEDMYLKNLKEK